MKDLKDEIKTIAYGYLTECDDTEDIPESFPQSIVDYVMEYSLEQCHFPARYTEQAKVDALSKCKYAIAMACVDVYAKIGNEGQVSYSANGIQRMYKSDWINSSLIEQLPNYVGTI